MRKIILATLILSIFCSTVYAVNIFNLFRRSEAPAIRNAAEVRAILQSLAPTEAEAKAISELQKRTLTPELASPDAPINPNAQVGVQAYFITVSSPLAEMIIQAPAMSWGILIDAPARPCERDSLVPTNRTTLGRVLSAVYAETPILVRFLDKDNTEKFIQMPQSQQLASVLQTPKVILHSGQKGMINDTNAVPFVEGVHPVVADGETAYQPIIRFIHQGTSLMLQGSALQDGSSRLSHVLFSRNKLVSVRTTRLLDDQSGKTITVQVPVVQSLQISISDVVVPSGMSLLLAYPSMEGIDAKEQDKVFLLITPKVVESEGREHIKRQEFWKKM